jgi:multidrug efflux pump subunit AcrA (membrane-fusion protein)
VWLTGKGLGGLSPGIAVSGWIVTDRHDGVVIPKGAVVRDDHDHPYVFVGRAVPFDRRPVELGVEMGGRVEVISGVAVGEAVVTEGAYELLWSSFATSFTPQD